MADGCVIYTLCCFPADIFLRKMLKRVLKFCIWS